MKYASLIITLLLFLISSNAFGFYENLKGHDFYIRKGFNVEWVTNFTSGEWILIPGNEWKEKSLRIVSLPFPDKQTRSFLSLRKYPPETYTYCTHFTLDDKDFHEHLHPALFLRHIGDNWAVYINSKLIHKEIFIAENGTIKKHRSLRNVLLYVNPSILKTGKNSIAFQIIGNPVSKLTGFFRSSPYLVGDYDVLNNERNEILALIVTSIYLVIGLYYLFLFLLRRSEKFNLVYSFFSIGLFVYFISRSTFVYSFIEDSNLILRIEYISLYSFAFLIILFFDLILKNRVSLFTKIFAAYSTVLILASTVSPVPFIQDLLKIWQYSAFISISYVLFILFSSCLMQFRELKGYSLSNRIVKTLVNSVPGNLLFGTILILCCAVFDIIDSLFLHYGLLAIQYGFFLFISGLALILSNRIIFIYNSIEKLNIDLNNKINDLNEANKIISLSEEKYRTLVEGSNDIIFTLDNQWKFLSVNTAINSILNIKPNDIQSLTFTDLIYEGEEITHITKEIIRRKLEEFAETKKPLNFKAPFNSQFKGEPKELRVRIEYINIEGKEEILGKASHIIEDSLIEYFDEESQRYKIGNFLITAEEITQRVTRNLIKYMQPIDIMPIRIALREIIINAIEHGNLNISFEEKTKSQENESYFEFISERQKDPQYKSKKVTIEHKITEKSSTYIITDEGNGFDYNKYLGTNGHDVNTEMLFHGRGILMTKNIFDDIKYNEKGNSVTLIKYF